MFKRRIGPHPHANGGGTSSVQGCPDIWELESGEIAVIGRDQTALLLKHLPPDASCGPDERIVVLDRHVLINAREHIPTA